MTPTTCVALLSDERMQSNAANALSNPLVFPDCVTIKDLRRFDGQQFVRRRVVTDRD
jgi:hypothetical protein